MSVTTTRGIEVRVRARFHPEQSKPQAGRWFFSYTVTIANHGDAPARLRGRRWVITDAHGDVEVVEGEGVVGEQPRLEPGDAFEYTSFCPLGTSLGAMHGSYRMETDDGATFDAEIAPFTLADPATLN